MKQIPFQLLIKNVHILILCRDMHKLYTFPKIGKQSLGRLAIVYVRVLKSTSHYVIKNA